MTGPVYIPVPTDMLRWNLSFIMPTTATLWDTEKQQFIEIPGGADQWIVEYSGRGLPTAGQGYLGAIGSLVGVDVGVYDGGWAFKVLLTNVTGPILAKNPNLRDLVQASTPIPHPSPDSYLDRVATAMKKATIIAVIAGALVLGTIYVANTSLRSLLARATV